MNRVWRALVLLLLLTAWVYFIMSLDGDCKERGGTLVRGLVWLECVDAERIR